MRKLLLLIAFAAINHTNAQQTTISKTAVVRRGDMEQKKVKDSTGAVPLYAETKAAN